MPNDPTANEAAASEVTAPGTPKPDTEAASEMVSEQSGSKASAKRMRSSVKKKRHDDKFAKDDTIAESNSPWALVAVMAFLIFVMLVSFIAVGFISDLFNYTPAALMIIKLIFALLCGVAGGIVGGTAVVRSTFNVSGSPAKATIGGGAAMIVVGFFLASYIPDPPTRTYSLDIHNVPHSHESNGERYFIRVFGHTPIIPTANPEGDKSLIRMNIPTENGQYKADIEIWQGSKVQWKCQLTFSTNERPREGKLSELFARREPPHFNLYFTESYIDRVVDAAANPKKRISETRNACLEGALTDAPDKRVGFDGNFLVEPQNVYDRVGRRIGIRVGPAHIIKAFEISRGEPNEVEQDVSPTQSVNIPSPSAPSASSAAPPAPSISNPSVVASGVTASTPSSITTPSSVSSSRAHTAANAPPAAAPSPSVAPSNKPSVVTSSVGSSPEPRPEPVTPRDSATLNPSDKQLHSLVDRYVRGEDFERKPLYDVWDQVKGYVVEGFRKEYANRTPFTARYLHLISNALNEIEDQRFVPPLRNPNFAGKVKPDRLLKSNSIPGFEDADYARVVDLLDEANDDLRKAAQRLVRLFPSYHFYKPLQAYLKKATTTNNEVSLMAEGAAYYFYNRIVEFQGSFPLDDKSREWIKGNYENGQAWIERVAARDASDRILGAMLDYARASVLWDWGRKETEAAVYFRKMLETVRSLDVSYPVNPQHIGTALAVTNGFSSTKVPASARPYAPDDRRKLSGTSFVAVDNQISLFSVPDASSKELGKVPVDALARMILRAETWDLVQVGKSLGWAERKPVATAGIGPR